ncbi:sulfotransferase domain-containing protein [Solicola gregarius]|uniref:Sulfotransferase domain-containing protein n=1 Tax=Solicola gregarius TaxID=2908642 RepID=A0AA46TJG8_9ACTN|nr:sulfotransferase domain-containing protein [Solicola gregarius]UYM06415.1 sulfotransferase domain-containing protein [Solicola gregarius]
MPAEFVRYRSPEEDSDRWRGFSFRDGDIVISTRSKSGTTWVQMICALLVHQEPDLPEPLAALSPWLDWLVTPRDEVYERLARQSYRRVIKTHTPLDGVPIDHRATYIVVARHPLDMAVSLYHQGDNIDRERVAELTGGEVQTRRARPNLHDWLLAWIDSDADPRAELDSLPGVMWHLRDAWARRQAPNILLVRYADLARDLDGQMRDLAARLGIAVDDRRWSSLVEAASFEQMRTRSTRLVTALPGVLKDEQAFFRRGTPGAGREVLTPAELERYERRAAQLAPPDLLGWLHDGG